MIGNKGLKMSIQIQGEQKVTVWEEDIVRGLYGDSTPNWLDKNNAILDCYAFFKNMQEDEMKKNNHKIQSCQGTFQGYLVSIHEMSADLIIDSQGKVEMVDSRDMTKY